MQLVHRSLCRNILSQQLERLPAMQPGFFGQILVQVLIAAQLPHDVSSQLLLLRPAIQAATPPSGGRPATSKDLQLGHLPQDVAELSVGHALQAFFERSGPKNSFPSTIQRIYYVSKGPLSPSKVVMGLGRSISTVYLT